MTAAWVRAAGLLAGLAACPASAAEPADILLSEGVDQVQIRTVDDPPRKTVELIENGRTLWGSRNLFLSDSVLVLWRRQKPGIGPDLIVGGFTGGNHCSYDVMSIALDADQPVQALSQCNHDQPRIETDADGAPRFSIFFDVAGFNAALAFVAGTEIPLIWDRDRFVVDAQRLITPLPDRATLERMAQTIRGELATWRIAAYKRDSGLDASAPQTNQILLDLILHGHTAEAWALLDLAWPAGIDGQDLYRDDFNRAIADHRLWRQLALDAVLSLGPHAARH
jgi:hypothetical protein